MVAAALSRVRAAAALEEQIDEEVVQALADDLGVDPVRLSEAFEFVEATGLGSLGGEGLSAGIQHAGEQYLALNGEIDPDVLSFLPNYVDDLHARRALISAGTVLVDEFRGALVSGRAVEYAQDLVPEAFAPAVTDFIAVQMYSASVALLVRLSDERPAGCVAEEIIAVSLVGNGEAWLDMEAETGVITAEEAEAATPILRGLFALFEDDDVLDMFEMEEPADAAVAGHSETNRQLGVADQRVQAWFRPFSWTIQTGYLSDRSTD